MLRFIQNKQKHNSRATPHFFSTMYRVWSYLHKAVYKEFPKYLTIMCEQRDIKNYNFAKLCHDLWSERWYL